MEELKIIYDLITSVWKLVKKYGCSRLTDEQWESFVEDGKRDREIYHGKGEMFDLFYRGMFSVVQDYYIQKNSKG
ncbi:hypothetical protein [uncultured Bacteroides sp.]|uniref:hypothetical protein n=1 Tax=uncultured Bacteroides sp. TaxID=162156 RepID=UPI002608E26A|nr:hypothetical protein [uncultured Bacteroides sp.]